MRTSLLFLCLTISALSTSAQTNVIENVAQKLRAYYQFYPIEKVQLTADKEVYQPRETIWFSMLITDATGQTRTPFSNECQVELYSSQGERLAGDVYRTHSGPIKGDLLLPENLQEGSYVLVARPNLLNSADEAFYKRIDINFKNENAFRLQEMEVSNTEQANAYSFRLTNMQGDPAKKEKLEATLYNGSEMIQKQKFRTDTGGQASVNLNFSDQNFERPLSLTLNSRRQELNYTTTLPVKDETLDISIYPEGGQLVAGTQNLGFTIHNQLGQPVLGTATITDEHGNKLAQGKTPTPGFGIVPANFEKDGQYSLEVTSQTGTNEIIALPPIQEAIALSVIRTDGAFIYANLIPPSSVQNEPIYLIANKGEHIFWASKLTPSGPTRLKIPKKDLPNGINQLTVFNQEEQVLATRLVYVDQEAEQPFELTAPREVKAGEVFHFTLKTNETEASLPEVSLGISAAEESKDWPTQWAPWLAINADLEKPLTEASKLLQSPNRETSMNYLLIANRMKNASWSRILNFDREREQSKHLQSGVSGQIVNQSNEPVANAKVSFIHAQNMQIIQASTDGNGTFFQQAIAAKDLKNFAVKAIGPDGNENLTVKFDLSLTEQITEQVQHFIQTRALDKQAQFSPEFYEQNKALFTPVKRPENNLPKSEPSYKKYLMTGTPVLEVLKTIKSYRLEGDKIIFPGGTNSINAQDGALIVLDGHKLGTSSSVLNTISPQDIESINVSTSPVDIQRYTGLNSVGLIEIRTKRGEPLEEPTTKKTESLYENGYRIPRDFWQQKAEHPKQQPTTLFWNPAVKLSPLNHSEFEVNAGHVLGKFILRADIIDPHGQINTLTHVFEIVP
ncbi:hypothetical protein [Sunxiuqinia rutila]|uniref:carboxypeptidase-like regulatory domain-containing protein n=1 Tax=Sunxiuqinia rutila TaxID=1397841 RepID=UPI003D3681C1